MKAVHKEIPVLFRAERSGPHEGEVTAVFPTVPSDHMGAFTVYDHIGQHGSGDWGWYNQTRPATPAEYASLLRELRGIYERALAPEDAVYRLKVVHRITGAMRDDLNRQIGEYRRAMRRSR